MPSSDLMTASKIAAELSVPGAKVKKAITQLRLQPSAKKGACAYYDRSAVAKIKKAVR